MRALATRVARLLHHLDPLATVPAYLFVPGPHAAEPPIGPQSGDEDAALGPEASTAPTLTRSPSSDGSAPTSGTHQWTGPIHLRHGLTVAFAGTYPKDDQQPQTNEDAWAIHTPSGAVVVFDGATESFAARRWVSILAAQWRAQGHVDLAAAQATYRESSPRASSWAQEQAAARGSFTTIAALTPDVKAWNTQIVGDSAVLILRDGVIIQARPFTSATEFSSAPDALASHHDLCDAGIESLQSGTQELEIPYVRPNESTHVVLATDAVAAWLLVDEAAARAERVRALLACGEDRDWGDLVRRERASGSMKVDDSTVVILTVERQP